MPYKDREKQRVAQHNWYIENREHVLELQHKRRSQPGYRDKEYANKRGMTVEEYRQWKTER